MKYLLRIRLRGSPKSQKNSTRSLWILATISNFFIYSHFVTFFVHQNMDFSQSKNCKFPEITGLHVKNFSVFKFSRLPKLKGARISRFSIFPNLRRPIFSRATEDGQLCWQLQAYRNRIVFRRVRAGGAVHPGRARQPLEVGCARGDACATGRLLPRARLLPQQCEHGRHAAPAVLHAQPRPIPRKRTHDIWGLKPINTSLLTHCVI